MLDPFGNMKKYLTWTFILIIFLIISGVAVAQDYKKIIPINSNQNNIGLPITFITNVSSGFNPWMFNSGILPIEVDFPEPLGPTIPTNSDILLPF